MRLRLAPENTNYDFFKYQKVTFGGSMVLMVVALFLWAVIGLNFGIDFKGGTSIRTDSSQVIDVADYRAVLTDLSIGDVAITQVFDPSFSTDQHVAMIRIAALAGSEAITPETIERIERALKLFDPQISFTSVESVGPKVSQELIWSAILAMTGATIGILFYIWLRFEWQFAVGAVLALVHDVFITIGVFALFQIKFDLSIIAALLTILGYSINYTVVVFDRLRENLIKYKTMALRDVMNLSVNETLSRTLVTSTTTLVALISMLVLGGDVIRGFAFAIAFGVVLGTYSSVFVAKNIVLFMGVNRDGPKKPSGAGTQYADIDA